MTEIDIVSVARDLIEPLWSEPLKTNHTECVKCIFFRREENTAKGGRRTVMCDCKVFGSFPDNNGYNCISFLPRLTVYNRLDLGRRTNDSSNDMSSDPFLK